jgi:hypothetical protein
VRVKAGSKETCNCHATNPIDLDTHIELALSGSATRVQRVVVEVTPRIRKQMKDAPVTALEVLDSPPAGAHELHPDLLAQLQKAQVETIATSPALREEIARRNDSLLKKYGDEAVREAEEEAKAPPMPEEIRKARSLRN